MNWGGVVVRRRQARLKAWCADGPTGRLSRRRVVCCRVDCRSPTRGGLCRVWAKECPLGCRPPQTLLQARVIPQPHHLTASERASRLLPPRSGCGLGRSRKPCAERGRRRKQPAGLSLRSWCAWRGVEPGTRALLAPLPPGSSVRRASTVFGFI